MRLIDADKGLISKIQLETGCNFITAQKIVDSMSTIDAIPINVAIEDATNGDIFDCVFGGIAGYLTVTEKNTIMWQIAMDKWHKERFPYLTTTSKWLETPYKQIKR